MIIRHVHCEIHIRHRVALELLYLEICQQVIQSLYHQWLDLGWIRNLHLMYDFNDQ